MNDPFPGIIPPVGNLKGAPDYFVFRFECVVEGSEFGDWEKVHGGICLRVMI